MWLLCQRNRDVNSAAGAASSARPKIEGVRKKSI